MKRQSMDWSYFATRKRYDKDDAGQVIGSHYERLFTGVKVGGATWDKNNYLSKIYPDGGEMVYLFMLGSTATQLNVVFVHRKGDGVVYVNSKATTTDRDYARFYAEQAGATLVETDELPSRDTRRATGGRKVDSLEALLEKATVDF